MKALFLCHRFPYPPQMGGRIRPFHMLRQLGRRYEVTVAALVRSRAEAIAENELRRHCARTIAVPVSELASWSRAVLYLAGATPSSFGYFRAARLASAIDEDLRRSYDLICVHCSSVAPYVAQVRGIPKLLDFGDMDSHKWLAYAEHHRFPAALGYRWEGEKLRRGEAQLTRQFDLCSCTTASELESLRALGCESDSDWFPNGVDSDYFRPSSGSSEPDRLCFLGRMDYFPNVDAMVHFCAETWPLLRRRRPGVTLSIIGADPTPAVRRLAQTPGITVTGTVPDVRPPAWRAAVSIAPLRIARGTQNKVLESLAMGLPVVCSRLAARGVDAVAGEHLLVADTPAEQAEAIAMLLSNSAERQRLARAARARALSHLSWDAALRRFDSLVDRCVENHLNGVALDSRRNPA